MSDEHKVGEADGVMRVPIMLFDVLKFLLDVLVHGLALGAGGATFLLLWQFELIWVRALAFPAAFLVVVLAFFVFVVVLGLIVVRRIEPGTYDLKTRAALRWIVADSYMRFVERSFLRGYLKGFGPQRYFFYRALGARVDSSFLIGWDVRILDPWALEVGRDALIGSFAVISGHAVEGGKVQIDRVRIGDQAVIGMRAVLMPGVEVGEGAVVGAGALVTKGTRIPPHEVWAGVPARKIGETARVS